MEEMALFAAGPVVGKHRRHHPLFPVLFGAGAAFGTARRLAARYAQDFRSTGTSHLLAISGLHVGVLVVMFLAASAWLFGRRGFYFFGLPIHRRLGLRTGLGDAAVGGEGGGDGQCIPAGGGSRSAGQHSAGTGL